MKKHPMMGRLKAGMSAYDAYAALVPEDLSPEQRKLVEGKLETLKE